VTDAPADPTDGAGSSEPPVDELRERLLAAAAKIFALKGYDGTKIMDVVRESRLSTGAVYGRFKSKNDLLREAVVTRAVNAAHLLDPDAERVADLITGYAANTDAPLDEFEAMRLEAYVTARREPEVAAAVREAYVAWQASMLTLLDSARDDGTLAPDVDPEHVLFLVRILTMGLMLHRGSGAPGPQDQDGWNRFVARVVASFGSASGNDDKGGP
jgi:AcrR family transcriptional regulator